MDQSALVRRRHRVLAENRALFYRQRLRSSRQPLRILEVGCGAGGLGRAFQTLGFDYLGIDVDHRVIREALRTGVSVQQLDFMALPPEESFDVVCLSQVLEHATRPREFVRKLRQHLRRPGLLHVDVPNHGSLAGWPSRLLGGVGARFGAIEYPHHCMGYSTESLRTLLGSVPDWRVHVFTATPDDDLWGQAAARGVLASAYFRASTIAHGKSLLVGLASTELPSFSSVEDRGVGRRRGGR